MVRLSYIVLRIQRVVKDENSVDPDEAAHNEPPHLGLCCLQLQLSSSVAQTLVYRSWGPEIEPRPRLFNRNRTLIQLHKASHYHSFSHPDMNKRHIVFISYPSISLWRIKC